MNVDVHEMHISVSGKQLKLEVSVKDEGIGMTQAETQQVFNPFWRNVIYKRLNNRGFGVGLSICKQICENLGGDIKVFSELNSGSKFVFTMQVFDNIENDPRSSTESLSEGNGSAQGAVDSPNDETNETNEVDLFNARGSTGKDINALVEASQVQYHGLAFNLNLDRASSIGLVGFMKGATQSTNNLHQFWMYSSVGHKLLQQKNSMHH